MRVRFVPVLVLAGLCGVLQASGPTFWTIATAAEFLRGHVRRRLRQPRRRRHRGTAARRTGSPRHRRRSGAWLRRRRHALGRHRRRRPSHPHTARPNRRDGVRRGGDQRLRDRRRRQPRRTRPPGPTAGSTSSKATAAAKPFFDPEEKYIWALAVDAAGRLWVGAGNPAVIYRVEPGGASKWSTNRRPRTSSRSSRTARAACWPAPSRRAGCIASSPTIDRSSCSTPA